MNKLILSLFFLLSTGSFLLAQSDSTVTLNNKYPYINHPYYKGDPLQKKSTKVAVKIRGLGYGGADTQHEVEGERSNVRVNLNDSIYFIMNTRVAMYGDISQSLSLLKATVKRGKRIFNIGKFRTFGGSEVGGNTITCTVMDIGNNLIKIVPDEQLEVGEYAFIHNTPNAGLTGIAYSFGVKSDIVTKDKPAKIAKERSDDMYPRQ